MDGSAGIQQDRVEKPEHVDERLPAWHARPLRRLLSIREAYPQSGLLLNIACINLRDKRCIHFSGIESSKMVSLGLTYERAFLQGICKSV